MRYGVAHKILAVEWTKGKHLKLLKISCRPIIHEDSSKEVILSFFNWYCVAKLVTRANQKALQAFSALEYMTLISVLTAYLVAYNIFLGDQNSD